MKRKIFILLSILAISAFIVTGCGSADDSFPAPSSYSDELMSLGRTNRFAGVIVASGEEKIEKLADRNIASISVAVGDDVAKDQVLFTYDGVQAQSAYDKAAIELEQLRLSIDTYNTQRAELEAEKAAAPADEQLAYTIQIQEIDTSIREANYNITVKEKEVEQLEASVWNLEVKSPVAGKVQSINNEEMGNDAPFMVISRTDNLKAKTYINEENIADLTQGSVVLIRSRTTNDTWEGVVANIDSENPQSQQDDYGQEGSDVVKSSRYPVYIDLSTTDGLMLGQHVYVELMQEGE